MSLSKEQTPLLSQTEKQRLSETWGDISSSFRRQGESLGADSSPPHLNLVPSTTGPSHYRISSVDTQIADSVKDAYYSTSIRRPESQERVVSPTNQHLPCVRWFRSFSLYDILSNAWLMLILVLGYSFLVTLGPLLLLYQDKQRWCPYEEAADAGSSTAADRTSQQEEYSNPDYNTDPCRYVRTPWLLGLTLEECDISQRMLVSVLLGGTIGYERRSADRPAGIRTMCLVSLGGCFFTISSIMAFESSSMGWDASRVTAALPSGVGFLGGALIWKGTVFVDSEHREMHQVHGLTTAASLWLSAAIGVGAGGALYAVTCYATALVLLMLRYGPKLYRHAEDNESDDGEEGEDETEGEEGHRPEPEVETCTVSTRRVVIVENEEPAAIAPEESSIMERDESQSSSVRRMSSIRRRRSSVRKSIIPTFGS